MPYHVHILYKPKDARGGDFYELDLSEQDLMKYIVEPYLKGEQLMCGGKPINPLENHQITISETEKLSSELIPEIRLEKKIGRLTLGVSDEYYVVKRGKNVTRNFVTSPPKRVMKTEKVPTAVSKNVFIVHGRDTKPVKELKAMLTEFGLNPIVLHELPSGSITIIEKLEKYSENVGFAFAILTPDDVGFELNRFQLLLRTATFEHDQKRWFLEETITHELKPRARQNVLLEFGFFMGKLSRGKVCCLYKGNVDLPSDMQGIVYIPFKDSVNECRDKIIKELKAAGYRIEP